LRVSLLNIEKLSSRPDTEIGNEFVEMVTIAYRDYIIDTE